MIGVRVVEADNVFSALAPFALDAHQFARIDVVTVLWRVSTSIAAARGRGHCADITVYLAEQHSATLVRISFFAVTAKGFIVFASKLEHGLRTTVSIFNRRNFWWRAHCRRSRVIRATFFTGKFTEFAIKQCRWASSCSSKAL